MKYINRLFEKLCSAQIRKCHRAAHKNGHNMIQPGYKFAWWFKAASWIEFNTRSKS